MVFVNFWPLPFLDLSSAGKSICIVFSQIVVFWINLSRYLWLGYFGIIFSFPFFSLSRSDFRSQSGRAEQQNATSLCLWRLQEVQAEKNHMRAAYEWQTQIWDCWQLLSVLFELDQIGHQLYPQLNKKLSLITAQMETAVTAWHKKV